MRLTILTQYYPPEAGAPQRRLSDLADRLVARGHAVQVLTALPSYPGDRVFPEYSGRENSVEQVGGVRVARVGVYVAPLRKTTIQRLRNYGTFAWNAARRGRALLAPTDVVFMESPPLTLAPAGVRLAAELRVPLVSNISDIWPQTAVELGVLRPGPMLHAAEWLERWTYRRSAALTGQTEGICAHLRRMAPDKPLHFFPNGVNLASYAATSDREETRRRFGWQPHEFVVGYTGLFGYAQALHQVIDAGSRLEPTDHVRIVLFGDGPCRSELEARLADEAIRHVTIYRAQPPSGMPSIQSGLDAGLVPLAAKPIFEGARPSKLLEIMAAGKPVVFCGRGEAARLVTGVTEGPAGVVVPPESPEDLAAAIRRLAADGPACAAMGRAGRRLIERDFDRGRIADGLEAFLLQVVDQAATRQGGHA